MIHKQVLLLLYCLFCPFITSFNLTSTGNPSLVTQVQNGLIEGITLPTANNKTVTAFLGIPYAKPPIANLRFQPPEKPESWSDILKANKQPSSCMQSFKPKDFQGAQETTPSTPPSEDCLYLNVFVPDIAVRVHKGGRVNVLKNGLPVMVYFHGGRFSTGSSLKHGPWTGNQWTPDPRELASTGQVIVISVQYRLGSFGFLFMDTPGAPGNMGILDTQMALEWVKTNVIAFGGNPNSVTVMGHDSGATLALTLFSTNTDELFQRMILQSGGIQHPWSYVDRRDAFRRTLNLAALVGCPTSGSSKDQVIACLKSKNAEDIVNNEMGVVSDTGFNFQPFVPTSEGNLLKLEPRKLLPRIKQRFAKTQILIGTNPNEGTKDAMYFLPQLFPNTELYSKDITQSQYEEAIQKLFSNYPKKFQDLITFQYRNWTLQASPQFSAESILTLISDWQYNCPVDLVSDTLADLTNVYKYRFNVRNPFDLWPKWTGVKHGDEMDYIFGRPLASSFDEKFPMEHMSLSKFMIETWSNFAKYGNPNGISRAQHHVGWPKYDLMSKHVLEIGTFNESYLGILDNEIFTPIVQENRNENCGFWNTLIPTLMEYNENECKEKVTEVTKFLPLNPNFQKVSPLFVENTAYKILQEKDKSRIYEEPYSATSDISSTTTTVPSSMTSVYSTPTATPIFSATTPVSIATTDVSSETLNVSSSTLEVSSVGSPVSSTSTPVSSTPTTILSDTSVSTTTETYPTIPEVPMSTKVSFRMGVVQRPERPKNWKFYMSPGNDPVLVQDEKPSIKYFRKPTWRPGTYDPFGKVPASPYDQVYYSQPSQRSNDDLEKSYFPIS